MALKHLCKCLLGCAAQLEADLRININDYNNLLHDKITDETRFALEEAKNYHYGEIIEAVGVIIEKVKIIVFHQGNLEWLSNHSNFTVDDLKRFSYVKGQIYKSHQQAQQKTNLSKSEQNLSVPYKVKRDRRRTISEISLSTLETWENYLDQKEQGIIPEVEPLIEEEIKKPVVKRTISNARARKKFVSSTFGGFLDGEPNNKGQTLEAICEDTQQLDVKNVNKENETKNQEKNDKVIDDILDKFFYKYRDGDDSKVKMQLSKSCEELTDFPNNEITVRSKSSDDVIISDGSCKYGNTDQTSPRDLFKEAERTKPKIVDVIYKSNPTLI